LEEMSSILQRCGIIFSNEQLEQLWAYHQLLREYNTELNLTRIHNFSNMVLKLYVDSILPGQLMDLPSPLLDLGTGPGMPGILLKIAFPHLKILLAESRQKRVDFLKVAVERVGLPDVEVFGGITPTFESPVNGVITRAVENMGATLDRVRGCLSKGGVVVFMKGPHCDEEIQTALIDLADNYKMTRDLPYRIPDTPHERRLVVFERTSEPLHAIRSVAMKRHTSRQIESEQNELFKDLKKLLTGRGIKKQNQAILSGHRQVSEALRDFPEACRAWISSGELSPPPAESPHHLAWYQVAPPLFRTLDVFGTNSPLLLISAPDIKRWDPANGLPAGCSVLVPFQDPENVGGVIRSAVAFGVDHIILLSESAHPYHPKSLRASGGAVLRASLLEGPSLGDLPGDLAIIPLSAEGRDISLVSFPGTFAFLPGMEGPGLPEFWRRQSIAIPIGSGVESLNASVATAIALYVWSQSRRRS
jgi:16S rRNA (guanine(527)-N(7))-methyltransferase RsmG